MNKPLSLELCFGAALLLAGLGCDLPTSEDPYPVVPRDQYTLQLQPGPFEKGLSALPVRVEAWVPIAAFSDGAHVHCVRLVASPGVISFPFASSAAQGSEQGTPVAAGHSAAQQIIHVAKPDEGMPAKAHVIARYVPVKPNDVVTIFGELVENPDCTGDVLAQSAVVFDLERPDDEHAPDGGDDEDGGAPEPTPEPEPDADTDGGEMPTPPDGGPEPEPSDDDAGEDS